MNLQWGGGGGGESTTNHNIFIFKNDRLVFQIPAFTITTGIDRFVTQKTKMDKKYLKITFNV